MFINQIKNLRLEPRSYFERKKTDYAAKDIIFFKFGEILMKRIGVIDRFYVSDEVCQKFFL
jgi:hypothetical protein